MSRVVSVHEYVLRADADPVRFEAAVRAAERRGLFDLPGLETYYLARGVRGVRHGAYAAIWVYESVDAWERLWGPVGSPRSRDDYPDPWKVWEGEVLAPFLTGDPDLITFTAYETIGD
jgi:hypothetical protein